MSSYSSVDILMPDNLGDGQSAERQRQPFLFGNIFFFFSPPHFAILRALGQYVALHSSPAIPTEYTVIIMISATDEPLHG